jgi:hypothetical protein
MGCNLESRRMIGSFNFFSLVLSLGSSACFSHSRNCSCNNCTSSWVFSSSTLLPFEAPMRTAALSLARFVFLLSL